MSARDFLLGEGQKSKTRSLYSPQQEQLLGTVRKGLQQQLPMGLENLRNILSGDEETFESYFAPARRGFEQKTLPSIAERFTGMLGEGGQRSSAFDQQIGQAGKEFEEDLFSQRIGMQQQALQQLIQLFQHSLAPTQEVTTTPRQSGFIENLIMSLSGGASNVLGKYLGRPKK